MLICKLAYIEKKKQMKSIYLIVMVCLIASCNLQTKTKKDNNKSTNISVKTNSAKNATKTNSEILKLPIIGSFKLSKMKIDSLNAYGAGDCWGEVKRYSLPNGGLAIDSTTCGEYGFTYTYYLLDDKDFIQVVYIKKSESILNPKTNAYFYVQEERVIDFNSDPATSKIKMDTINDYKQREISINKSYSTKILKDKQVTYKHFEKKYQETWKKKIKN